MSLRDAIYHSAIVSMPKAVYPKPINSRLAWFMIGLGWLLVLSGCIGLIWLVNQGDLQVIPVIRYPWPRL